MTQQWNPTISTIFNDKTDNWFIKPIITSTNKYPNVNKYDWNEESRGDFTNDVQLSSAPVLLL